MHRRPGLRSWLLAAALFPSLLQADPPASVTYTYDELGRLRTGTFDDGRKADYQYDAAGNRTTLTMGSPPTLAIGAPASSPTEGSNLVFPVTKTGTSSQNITVDCIPTDATAESGGAAPFDDYVRATQTVTFLPTDPSPTTRSCTITTKADSYFEGAETVNAALQNASAGATITTANAVGTITDDDPAPSFSVSGDAQAEGTNLAFGVTKSGLTEHSHNVSYSTSDGSATTADADYTSASAALTFSSGQTSQVVNIATGNDSKYEANETLSLNLSSPTGGATIGTSSATGTINDNDAAPIFVINDPAAVNEGGQITFTVTKSGSTGLAHSLSWATANNSASAGTDYTAASSTVTFQPSDTTRPIAVQTVTDGVYEGGDETFFVNLTMNGSSNGAVISDGQGVGTVADVDAPVPSVPGNLRISAPGPNGPNYTVLWNASTGPVSYYVLEQNVNNTQFFFNANINAPATSKTFNNMASNDYAYRVKACSASNQCSTYSNTVARTVCNPQCDSPSP